MSDNQGFYSQSDQNKQSNHNSHTDREILRLGVELDQSQRSFQDFKEYSIGAFARLEIKIEALVRAATFLATTTAGVIILAILNSSLNKGK